MTVYTHTQSIKTFFKFYIKYNLQEMYKVLLCDIANWFYSITLYMHREKP